jgi:D-alanine-D-alanine ligase
LATQGASILIVSNGTVGPVGRAVTELVVLFGGRSAEHDISCVTARHVINAVDRSRYALTLLGIDREGVWHQADPEATELSASGPVIGASEALTSRVGSDAVVLPLLHGPLGEDGTIQGLLEVVDLPYVGSGVLGSALAMDKAMAKIVVGAAGIAQALHLVVTERDLERGPSGEDELISRVGTDLGFPCFVKPANMGSSVGVNRVDDSTGLIPAVRFALTYDRVIVIEEAISGRELEVAVLGDADPIVSVPGEIIPGDRFYSYADKYLDGRSRTLVPAELDPAVANEIRDLALRAYRALRCEGLARCDFFLAEDGRGLLLNEVNTMPGFTPISMFPQMMEASGVPYPEIIERLITLAFERHATRRRRVDH